MLEEPRASAPLVKVSAYVVFAALLFGAGWYMGRSGASEARTEPFLPHPSVSAATTSPSLIPVSFSGEVKNVSASARSLTVSLSAPLGSLKEGSLVPIVVPEGVSLIAQGALKTQEEMQKEFDAYDAEVARSQGDPGKTPSPPSPYATREIRFSDVHADDVVSVSGQLDESAKSVRASVVEVMPSTSPAPPPSPAQ